MLRALEIAGFKSFPDRTRFDFPPGITVVVGPNGSGKSNLVDAIKWVLGEQSPKSLRGKEMADVIFKGTGGPAGRRPSNTAEATLIFDNDDRRLRVDTDEVRVTRRVYRSGEGEYLINGELCRLKDVRDLFRGTGIGTDTYSLIEQGKVDQMLQASAKERRGIFEEAAGISRFKAKRIEAERRLARVEQHMLRLGDVVNEVGQHYRVVKTQAGRAARFQEYSQRLQALRLHVAAADRHAYTEQLGQLGDQAAEVQGRLSQWSERLATASTAAERIDEQLADFNAAASALQTQINELHQRLASRDAQRSLNIERRDDFARRAESGRGIWQQAESRRDQLLDQAKMLAEQFDQADSALRENSERLASAQSAVAAHQAHIEQSRQAWRDLRRRIDELSAEEASATAALAAAQSQIDILDQSLAQLDRAATALASERQEALTRRESHAAALRDLTREVAETDSELKSQQLQLDDTRRLLGQKQKALDKLRQAQIGSSQRAEVIQEMENRSEGVGTGAQQLIQESRQGTTSTRVIGLIADLIRVNVQHAQLIDIALGETAQYVVVDGGDLVDSIARGDQHIGGRVGIVQLNDPARPGIAPAPLVDEPGVISRMDQLVQCEPPHQPLVERLLGRTWLVKSLTAALALRRAGHLDTRFVTLGGDVVEADGTVLVGWRSAALGIVSRRSELRALHREIHRLAQEIREEQTAADELEARCAALESQTRVLIGQHTEIATQLADHKAIVSAARQQSDQLDARLASLGEQQSQATERRAAALRDAESSRQTMETASREIAAAQHEAAEREAEIARAESRSAELASLLTEASVGMARAQLHLDELTSARDAARIQCQTAEQELAACRRELAGVLWGGRRARREIAAAELEMGTLRADKASADERLSELHARRAAVDGERRRLAAEMTQARDEIRRATDELHQIELRQNRTTMQRDALDQQIQQDYGIDMTRYEPSAEAEIEGDRATLDQEIADLRRKLSTLGSVNIAALDELQALEERYNWLNSQYEDLKSAHQTLDRIIARINNDCRRLFLETLDAIRVNFQQLFRQTFGGGRADLVLEEDVDVLDAGVEILATPPGKPEFSNSLLSGGEKALTAVSLLLAIFQFRPSPFCILDEVDAPFDEANIGRFVDVLKSFLHGTRIVIVTHSKKTMTAANTLYGVTMQESGVSKRVSVRFEDVSDDGQISAEAIHRTVA